MKKKTAILIFILSLCKIAKAQNLVPNGDFEIYTTCPPSIATTTVYIDYATGWNLASGTPDYCNSCSINDNNVPNPFFGYQKDCYSGNGYAGEYISNLEDIQAGFDNYREYIYTKLIDTLKAQHIYLVNTYVSLGNLCNYAAKIGLLFTDTITTTPDGVIILANPQVTSNYILGDTLNWMLIQDTIIAQGNETYLTIGNFSTTGNSDTVKVYQMGFGTSNDYSYYYVDGVSVYDVTSGSCNNYWDAGFNKYIFAGDSIRLGAINTDNSTYLWQNSAGGSTYLSSNTGASPWSTPSITTTYYVKKTCPNNNMFLDTVTVYVQPTTGIKQTNKNEVSINIYPNPSNGKLYVSNFCLNEKSIEIEISDIAGKLIVRQQSQINNNLVELNLDLNNGIYFIKVVHDNGGSQIKKIIINK